MYATKKGGEREPCEQGFSSRTFMTQSHTLSPNFSPAEEMKTVKKPINFQKISKNRQIFRNFFTCGCQFYSKIGRPKGDWGEHSYPPPTKGMHKV